MSPERVVMISCNSSTAARDAKKLDEVGYKATKMQAVDMFARTGHVESVVCLERVRR
jgi:23S rRNA (uracil1939-C5)-methyltransferase